jgi:hypothetical protein
MAQEPQGQILAVRAQQALTLGMLEVAGLK